jgi:tryptophanyl-tRNA synthetase
LLLSDSPDEIHRKLKKAVTATDADAKSPGVENLMLLLSHFGTSEQHTHFQKELGEGTIKYSELKETLAKQISEYFAEFRERKRQLTADKKKLTEVLAEGSQKAKAVSSKTLEEVKQKIGLL